MIGFGNSHTCRRMTLVGLTVEQGPDSDGHFDASAALSSDPFSTELLAVSSPSDSRRCTLLILQLVGKLLRLAETYLCLKPIYISHSLLLLVHQRLLLLLKPVRLRYLSHIA